MSNVMWLVYAMGQRTICLRTLVETSVERVTSASRQALMRLNKEKFNSFFMISRSFFYRPAVGCPQCKDIAVLFLFMKWYRIMTKSCRFCVGRYSRRQVCWQITWCTDVSVKFSRRSIFKFVRYIDLTFFHWLSPLLQLLMRPDRKREWRSRDVDACDWLHARSKSISDLSSGSTVNFWARLHGMQTAIYRNERWKLYGAYVYCLLSALTVVIRSFAN